MSDHVPDHTVGVIGVIDMELLSVIRRWHHRESLIAWLTQRGGELQDFMFPSRTDADGHISTRQYARLEGPWVESIGLGRSAYGTHSLRHTKVALIYKRTGDLRAVQILLGHTKLESTVR